MTQGTGSRLGHAPDLRDLAATLTRRKWLIAGVTVTVVALAVLYSYSRTPIYTASAGIHVRPALTDIASPQAPEDLDSQTESNLATSVAVASIAGRLMGSHEPAVDLLQRTTANMITGSEYLTVSFSDDDPDAARRGARAFGDAYLQYRQQQAMSVIDQQMQGINEQLRDVREKVSDVSTRLRQASRRSPESARLLAKWNLLTTRYSALQDQLVTLLSITTDTGEVVDPPERPSNPTSPRHPFDIASGVVVGLGLGVGLALVRERRSNAVRTSLELEQALGVPVVASIPRGRQRSMGKGVVVSQRKRRITVDAYRRLRTDLLDLAAASGTKTFLVTSAAGGEGTTTTVANLGAALAEIGKRVIVVSADLSGRRLDELLGVDGRPGFTDALEGSHSPFDVVEETQIRDLRLVPRGNPSNGAEPVNLLHSDRMRLLLMAWADDADVVLIDAPPVLRAPDSLVLARMAGGVLFVAEAGTSRWDDLAAAREELDRAGGVFAAVLNGVVVSRRDRRAWKRRAPTTRPMAIDQGTGRSERPHKIRQEL